MHMVNCTGNIAHGKVYAMTGANVDDRRTKPGMCVTSGESYTGRFYCRARFYFIFGRVF